MVVTLLIAAVPLRNSPRATMLAKAQKAFKSAAPGANLDGALDRAKRALKEEECCEVHVLIGAIFTAQDEHEMAEGAFERALSLDEESAQAWKGLAALLEAQGRERRAASHAAGSTCSLKSVSSIAR